MLSIQPKKGVTITYGVCKHVGLAWGVTGTNMAIPLSLDLGTIFFNVSKVSGNLESLSYRYK